MLTSQNPNCKLAVLVPVYNESEDTLARLLRSLTEQEDASPLDFEVICLINNDRPGTKNYKAVHTANQKLLQSGLPEKFNKLNIEIIDCSSLRREISGCNIGKVRNLLVREAASRFRGNNHNGILLHVDADVYFKDRQFIRKSLDLFDDPSVLGVVGGKWRETFVEDYPEYDPSKLRAAFAQIGLSKQCKELSNFLKGRRVLHAFGGSNILTRCFESVAIGSFKSLQVEEDKEFGYRMWRYAESNNRKILVKKTELKVVASLRISERTGSTFRNEIEQFMRGEELIVKHPATPERLAVNEQTYELLKSRALKLPGGKELVEYIEDYGILWIH
jgi:glycosyltransferase involved in cell wall biosynthesis